LDKVLIKTLMHVKKYDHNAAIKYLDKCFDKVLIKCFHKVLGSSASIKGSDKDARRDAGKKCPERKAKRNVQRGIRAQKSTELKKSNLPRQISAQRRPPEISKKRQTKGDKYAKPTPRDKQKETSNET
jgi:hypothetical protein